MAQPRTSARAVALGFAGRYGAHMPRYALKIEYHGGPFAGWQRQDGPRTVQGAIEAAIAKIEPGLGSIAAAGRTDAGVHAFAQVAMVETLKDWDPFRLSEALNFHLKPDPIAILDAAAVADDWHPRFDALERSYVYRILLRRAPATTEAGLVWRIGHALDPDSMQAGADRLIGQHDFTTFRSSICQAKSPVKTLDEARVELRDAPGGQEMRLFFRARSFLHNQVRSFVGTLERVGAGAWTPDDVTDALESRNRAACGPVAPPDGLYLSGVRYENDPFDR